MTTASAALPSPKTLTIQDAIAEQKSSDKKIARLRKRSDEQLIGLALQCIADKTEAQAEYDMICDVLEERFPHEENEERIITPQGLATRTVTNTYAVAGREDFEQAANAARLKEMLGKGYDVCVSEATEYAIPKHLYPELVKALGGRSDEFVRQGTRYTLTAKFRRMYTDSGMDFSECVTHTRKRKITVEPVSN